MRDVLVFGKRWPPETVCKLPFGFIAVIGSRFVERGGLSPHEAWHRAREVYHYMLPKCGGRFGHPDFSWTVGDAAEWADEEMEHWEAG